MIILVKKRKKSKIRSKSKEKPKTKKVVQEKSTVDIVGDNINKSWRRYVKENWHNIKQQLSDIEPDEYESVYMYVTIDKATEEAEIDDISSPDYYRGASPSRFWLAAIPVDRNTTKKELLEQDVAEDSAYYDDIDIFGN